MQPQALTVAALDFSGDSVAEVGVGQAQVEQRIAAGLRVGITQRAGDGPQRVAPDVVAGEGAERREELARVGGQRRHAGCENHLTLHTG